MKNVVLTRGVTYEFTERMPLDHNKFADMIISSALIVQPGFGMPVATKSIKSREERQAKKAVVDVFGYTELSVLKTVGQA